MAKTIMIVDDSASRRQVVGITLRDAGYDLIEVGDGKEALKSWMASKSILLLAISTCRIWMVFPLLRR